MKSIPDTFAPIPASPRFIDLTGQEFGRLTVIGFDGRDGKHSFWWCRCVCGNPTRTTTAHMRSGHTLSCGCLLHEAMVSKATVHGKYRTPVWHTYRGMIARCTKSTSGSYDRYGALGITVCDRWLHGENGKSGFECFFADMGDRPEGMTIDRRDAGKGYNPDNCRWATAQHQARNKRNSRFVTLRGERVQLADACERFGLDYNLVSMRIRRGWSDEKALGVAP